MSAILSISREPECIGKPVRNIGWTPEHPDFPQRGFSTVDPSKPSRYLSAYVCLHTEQRQVDPQLETMKKTLYPCTEKVLFTHVDATLTPDNQL